MDFLLAGEGPSDLGSVDDNGVLKKGAMAFVIDAFCEQNSLPAPQYLGLLRHARLSKLAAKPSRGGPERPAKKNGAAFYDQAAALAKKAKDDACGAVYFQDSDREDWNGLYKAVTLGFKSQDMGERCVAMLPNPKSEAWLLAYFQNNESSQQAYNHAERFEEMSGNDSSPKSLKKKLAELLDCEVNEIYNHITEEVIHDIEWNRVDMPSFNQFKTDFRAVVQKLSHSPTPAV